MWVGLRLTGMLHTAQRMRTLALASVTAIALTTGPFGQAASRPGPAQPDEAFEVVSVKPMGAAPGEALANFGSGCDGSFPRVESARFTVTTTVYALITWAYGFNRNGGCSFATNGNLIIGGPGWVRSERFEIQGVLPANAPAYSLTQFLDGETPRLESMLRTMLADRFKLTVHREMRDTSVYALSVARSGKLASAKESDGVIFTLRRQRDATGLVDHLVVAKVPMIRVALMISLVLRRPVIDRTGLSGDFSFDLPFAPPNATPGDTSAPSLFTALQEQLGLRLEETRAPVDALVIDSVEQPSPN